MNVEFAASAVEKLVQIPEQLREQLHKEILRLAENPVALSSPAPPAYPGGGMRFRAFIGVDSSRQWYVEVLWVWKASVDENTIVIIGLGPDASIEDMQDQSWQ